MLNKLIHTWENTMLHTWENTMMYTRKNTMIHMKLQPSKLRLTICGLVLTIMLCLSLPSSEAEAVTFKDTKGHWAERAVETLAQEGIIEGNDTGSFTPDQPVTRAELAAMLVRAIGPAEETPQDVPVFRDVYSTQWHYPYIQEAAARKLVQGSATKEYFPDRPVKRQEAAVILARALEPGLDKLLVNQDILDFKDADLIGAWAENGVYLAQSKQIIRGDVHKNLNPNQVTSRAELAVMILNFLRTYQKVNIPVLTYHNIAPEGTFKADSETYVGQYTFTAQMQLLADQGYQTISTQQLFDYLQNGTALPAKPVMITFDDGYESNYTLAFPVLKRLRQKAVINIVVGATPGEAASLNENKSLLALEHLNWTQMREMVFSGLIEIQSHTYDSHRLIRTAKGKLLPTTIAKQYFSAKGQQEDLAEYTKRLSTDFIIAKEIIERKLGTKVTVLAYPYGAYTQQSEIIAKKAGYKMTMINSGGLVESGDSPYLIKRINIDAADSLTEFQGKLLGAK